MMILKDFIPVTMCLSICHQGLLDLICFRVIITYLKRVIITPYNVSSVLRMPFGIAEY